MLKKDKVSTAAAYDAFAIESGGKCSHEAEINPKETAFFYCNSVNNCWEKVESEVDGGEPTYPGRNDKCGAHESCASMNLNDLET